MNKEQTDITTGKQIRHLRTQSGMTQEELAGELNVTRQALSNWERSFYFPYCHLLLAEKSAASAIHRISSTSISSTFPTITWCVQRFG